MDVGAFLFHHPAPAILTAIIPLVIGALAYFHNFRATLIRRALEDPVVFLPFMLAAPFVFVFLVAQFRPFLYTRYLIVFLPYIYMFISVVLLSRKWRSTVVPVALVLTLTVSAEYWILRDYYVIEKPQTRELAQFVLSEAAANTAIVTGCNPAPPFECALEPGKATDADWSKYLFYLNYTQLPVFSIIPDVYTTTRDLDQLINQYRTEGKNRIIFMGSRAGLGYVETAVEHLEKQGISCDLKTFYQAVAAQCSI